jgi:hypothetical protein
MMSVSCTNTIKSFATRELKNGRRLQRGFVHDNRQAIDFDAIHDTLGGTFTKVVTARFHSKAVNTHHRSLTTDGDFDTLHHLSGNKVFTGTVIFDNTPI